MFMSKYDKIIARWQLLYKDLVVLKTIKRQDSKKLNDIRIQLRDLIMDIEEMIRIGIPEEDMNKKLREILNQCKQYQKIALAA